MPRHVHGFRQQQHQAKHGHDARPLRGLSLQLAGRRRVWQRALLFPRPEQVASLAEAELWELGWGYRAPRLFKLAREVCACGGEAWLQQLAAGEGEDASRRALMQLSGVGRKVADCCLLWLRPRRRRTGRHAPPAACAAPPAAALAPRTSTLRRLYTEIVARFQEEFGAERTGHAFMQLFVAELADFRKRVPRPSCSALRDGIGSEVQESQGQSHRDEVDRPAAARGGAREGRAKRARALADESSVTDEHGMEHGPVAEQVQGISATPRRSARSRTTAATPEKRRGRGKGRGTRRFVDASRDA